MGVNELAKLMKQIRELLDKGYVQPSSSPWGALVVGAESDQQVNIYSFVVRCDRRWPNTQ